MQTINGKGKNKALKNITINYPILYDQKIAELIDLGIVPSRSEAVRYAIRDFLLREVKELKLLGVDFSFPADEVQIEVKKRYKTLTRGNKYV